MRARRVAAAALLPLVLIAASGKAVVLDGNSPIDSNNHRFQAAPGPGARSTRVFRKSSNGAVEQVWEKADWNPVAFLSNDGDYLVTGYEGNNLLAHGHAGDETMLVFYHRNRLVKTVRLNEIILDQKHLRLTDSGVVWGYYEGFLADHEIALDTIEQRRLIYDATTGALIRAVASPSPLVKPIPVEPAPSPRNGSGERPRSWHKEGSRTK